MRRRMLSLLGAGVLSASALAAPGAAAGETSSSRAGICAGVAHCRVVARVDVTGDGAVDPVGVVRRGKSGAEEGSVTVRVRKPGGHVVSATRKTEFWHGSVWQGAGRLDGRAGRELVVGRIQGAHAQFFTALTWRKGRLVTLDAPGRGRFWGIDAAVWVSLGWQHRVGDPQGTIRKRSAVREGEATQGPFRGRLTTFRWTWDGWERVDRQVIYPMSEERAARWAGWRVRGIPRW